MGRCGAFGVLVLTGILLSTGCATQDASGRDGEKGGTSVASTSEITVPETTSSETTSSETTSSETAVLETTDAGGSARAEEVTADTPETTAAPEAPAPGIADGPAAVAYATLAPELPDLDPRSVKGLYRSVMDPSWASVRVAAPGEKVDYVVFLEHSENGWEVRRSILADEKKSPENERAVLGGVPEDLLTAVYPENAPAGTLLQEQPVESESLPPAGPAQSPPPEPVMDGVPEKKQPPVEKGLAGIQQEVEGYGGVAGVYVRDLKGDYGYGIRPDESFFGASVLKIPVMVAVYRKIDAAEISPSTTVQITPADWAAGAGNLQYEYAGTPHTIEEYLWRMMLRSDNVATNVLTRVAGGREKVNEVARSMGTKDTVLYQKLSSERAVVPSLGNRTTPQDMTAMLESIYDGRAASQESCRRMVALMRQNTVERWLKSGIPKGADVDVAHKAGWLYKVYNEVAIVYHEDRPYAVAILAKYGPKKVDKGEDLVKNVSRRVWETQSGE